MKRALLVLVLAVLGVLVAPRIASAHQAKLTLSCSSADAEMFLYPADATYVLQVDGDSKSFAPNGTFHLALNPNVNHTASLHITPGSDRGGKFDRDLSVENCVPATTTQAPTTTAATTTTVAQTTTTAGSTTSTSTSSSTTTTPSTSSPSSTTTAPASTSGVPSSVAPSTVSGSSSTPTSTPCTEPSTSPTSETTSSVCSPISNESTGTAMTSPSRTGTSDGSLPSTGRDLTALIIIATVLLIIGLAFRGPQIWAWVQRRRS